MFITKASYKARQIFKCKIALDWTAGLYSFSSVTNQLTEPLAHGFFFPPKTLSNEMGGISKVVF